MSNTADLSITEIFDLEALGQQPLSSLDDGYYSDIIQRRLELVRMGFKCSPLHSDDPLFSSIMDVPSEFQRIMG